MEQLRVFNNRIESLSLATYCVFAGVVALAGSVALIGLAVFAARTAGFPVLFDRPGAFPTLADAFGAIVFAPIAETLLLAGCLKISSSFGRMGSCVACALLWGVLHGLLTPIRFFGSVWSFFVFGFGYMLWRRRSAKHAFAAATVPHVIVNSVALAVLAGSAKQFVQAELASLHQTHGRKSLPCVWLHYASRLNSGVRPLVRGTAVAGVLSGLRHSAHPWHLHLARA